MQPFLIENGDGKMGKEVKRENDWGGRKNLLEQSDCESWCGGKTRRRRYTEREGGKDTGSVPIWVVPAISKIMQLQAFFSETALINNLYSTLYLLLFYPYSGRWRFQPLNNNLKTKMWIEKCQTQSLLVPNNIRGLRVFLHILTFSQDHNKSS